MNWLQIRLFGPIISPFLPHSYGYEPANEPKIALKPPNFRFSPCSPTASSNNLNSPIALWRNNIYSQAHFAKIIARS